LTPEEKKILGLTAPAHSLVHLYEGVIPPLIPLLIGVFQTDYFHLGLVVTVFSYTFGLGSLPSGFFADKIGPRRLVAVYLFGAGILSILVWPIDTLLAYAVITGGIGLFSSTYHPAANTLISHAFREKGQAFAVNGIAGSLGIAVCPLLCAWIASILGWKSPHILFGILGVGLGCYALTLPRNPIKKDTAPPTPLGSASGRVFSVITLVIYYGSAVIVGITYKGVMTFLPAYMGQNVRLGFIQMDEVAVGGTFATFALLFGSLGQYIAGRMVDRYSPEKIYLGSLLIGTVWVFVMAKSTDLMLVLSAVLYSFFYFSTQPTQNYLITRYLPAHRHGLGFGLHFFLSFGVGSTAAAVAGYLADRFGLAFIFYIMGLFFIGAVILSGLLVIRAHGLKAPSPPSLQSH